MRRITIGALLLAMLAMLAGPVYAQHNSPKNDDNPLAVQEATKRRDKAAIEREYERTLHATDGKATPATNDPWANMRGADNTKAKR